MTPVIDDNAFAGADKGLTVPMRRISDGIYQLSIRNLDHADPPAPYAPGGVPRDAGFNRNVVALPVAGGMPAIRVECTIAGFDPAEPGDVVQLLAIQRPGFRFLAGFRGQLVPSRVTA